MNKEEEFTALEKAAVKWVEETDTMQFSQIELLAMFAVHFKTREILQSSISDRPRYNLEKLVDDEFKKKRKPISDEEIEKWNSIEIKPDRYKLCLLKLKTPSNKITYVTGFYDNEPECYEWICNMEDTHHGGYLQADEVIEWRYLKDDLKYLKE